jgi:peptide/nickel transport system permease protein
VSSSIRKLAEGYHKLPKRARTSFWVGLAILTFFSIVGLFANYLVPYDPSAFVSDPFMGPSLSYIMGTDSLGRDIFSRVMTGAKFSLLIALTSTLIAGLTGTVSGSWSAYIGGKIDSVLSLFMDAVYAFPTILIALIIATALGASVLNIGIAVAFGQIPSYFRVIRSQVISLKESQFIEAERSIGAGVGHILLDHILPNTLSSILVLTTLNMGRGILAVSGLGFLGLGLPAPTPEWGTDLGNGRLTLTAGLWWPSTFPGLMIFLSVLGFNMFGESLDLALQPRSRSSKK